MTKDMAIEILQRELADYEPEHVLAQALRMAIEAMEQEPKTGYWIKYDKEYFTAEKLTPVIHSIRECSECHTRIADFCGEMKYCPNCGAKMESDIEKRKPCINYSDGCEELAGCPCVLQGRK